MQYTQAMKEFVFVLGTHPDLSLSELKAVLGDIPVERHDGLAFVKSEKELDAESLMQQLGGTIKIIELIGDFDEEVMVDWLFDQIDTDSKFHFGFSEYPTEPGIATKKDWKTLQNMGLSLKRVLKTQDISARFVQSKEVVLSSVIVHKERLLKNGVEIVLFKGQKNIRFGKTLAVQPFQDFSKRDFGRPGRDSKSGMLPPKLARMMVNISQPTKESVILDPFCGSGTVLQEALLLGYNSVIGSDKSKKAVEDTLKNLQWINKSQVSVYVCAAEQLITTGILERNSVDRIVFEGYLGPPAPKASHIMSAQKELQQLYTRIFPVLAQLLTHDGHIVAALPFWKTNEKEFHLNINGIVQSSGMKLSAKPLLYRRPQSVVGREIIQLKK